MAVYLPLGYHSIRELGGSPRWKTSSRCASLCSSTQTAELVVILMACSTSL